MTDKEPTMGTHFTIPKPELRDIIADRILEHYPLADRKLALHMADHITPLVEPIAGKTSMEDDVLLRPQKVREIKMVSEKRLQELILEAHKAGMLKVVIWINDNSQWLLRNPVAYFYKEKWKEFLKSEGIK